MHHGHLISKWMRLFARQIIEITQDESSGLVYAILSWNIALIAGRSGRMIKPPDRDIHKELSHVTA